MQGKLLTRNVTISGNRTTIRLEEAISDALDQICTIEDKTIHELCSLIEQFRHGTSRTSFVRAFIVTYFRTMANAAGKLEGGKVQLVLERAANGGTNGAWEISANALMDMTDIADGTIAPPTFWYESEGEIFTRFKVDEG